MLKLRDTQILQTNKKTNIHDDYVGYEIIKEYINNRCLCTLSSATAVYLMQTALGFLNSYLKLVAEHGQTY